MTRTLATPGTILVAIVLGVVQPVSVRAQTTTRVSVGPAGVQGNAASFRPAISGDGRWVSFWSPAGNLVPGDTNGLGDVFLHDRLHGTTTRVSLASDGTQGNQSSQNPAISADGRFIAFDSWSSTFVQGDNVLSDIFVHDRDSGITTRVSVGPGGIAGNDDSFHPSISHGGRWVAFASTASNLVSGDTNGTMDIFVHDRESATTTRVSVGPGGIQAIGGASGFPAISGDGRVVAFESRATNLVDGDSNGQSDVFVHDRQTGITVRVSVGAEGAQASGASDRPAISGDGRFVAYRSRASLVPDDTNGLDDVFVRDTVTATTTRVSLGSGGVQGNGQSGQRPAISADGRWVAFESWARNLVAGDTNGVPDVFVHDRLVSATSRVSVTSGGAQANGTSWLPALGADGQTVAFESGAGNLVPGDSNAVFDVFIRQLTPPAAPMPPENLFARLISGSVVTVRWTIPPGGDPRTGFVVEGGLAPGEVLASLPTGSTDPTFTFTAPTGSFFVRVHALDGAVRSPSSNEIRIHVNVPVPPSAPAHLLGLVDGSTLALAWTNTYEGGAPTGLTLDVTGALTASLAIPPGDHFSFPGVPPGTYTLALRARNAAGVSLPSNAVTLTFPGPCSGTPLTPTAVFAYRVGHTVFVDWAAAATGPAPTAYRLDVTGTFTGSFTTTARALSGVVGPGTYMLSVVALNACGASAASAPQVVVVP